MSTFEKILRELKKPFPVDRIHWRVGSTNKDKTSGIALAYLDARDVMNRLDEVCQWQDSYQTEPPRNIRKQDKHTKEYYFEQAPGRVICTITINGQSRADGAGETAVEGEKGGISDAFKRAAVKWGVGRYLYYLPTTWVPLEPFGRSYKISQVPELPNWAKPDYVPRFPQAKEYAEQFAELITNADDHGIIQLHAELDHETELPYVWRHLNSAQRGTIKEIQEQHK